VIDFGDMVYSWRVGELAIAVAYAMVGGYASGGDGDSDGGGNGKGSGGEAERRLAAAAALLKGFRAAFDGLSERELGLVRVLTACRLATSFTMGSYAHAQDPANTYLLLHALPAIRALQVWWAETPVDALQKRLGIWTEVD